MKRGRRPASRRRQHAEAQPRVDSSNAPNESGDTASAGPTAASEPELRALLSDARAAETRFRGLLEAAPDAIVMVDRDGHIVLVNRQTEALFGYERGELIGRPVEMLIPRRFHASHTRHREAFATAPRTRPMGVGLELYGQRRDASEFPVEVSLSAVAEQDGPLVISTIRDTTRRKRTEEALQEAEHEAERRAREAEATFEAMTDGVVMYDAAGHVLQMNQAARELFAGVAPVGFASRPFGERAASVVVRDEEGALLPPERWPTNRILRGESLYGGNDMDIQMTRLDGRDVFLNVRGAPIRDARGVITGAVAILRDVTDRRHLERRTRDSLEALLGMADVLVRAPQEAGIPEDETGATTHAVAQRLAEMTRRVLGCERVSVVVVDPATEALRPVAVAGLPASREREWQAEVRRSHLSDHVGDQALIARLRDDEVLRLGPLPTSRGEVVRSRTHDVLIAPMRVGEQLIGLLAVDRGRAAHEYTAHDMALAAGVARLAGIVIERDRLLGERRARMEAEARLSVLQTIVDELPSGIYLVRGDDARLVLANHAAAVAWGAHWRRGQAMANFLAEHDIHVFGADGRMLGADQLATMHTVRTGEAVPHQQEVIRHPDGTSLPILFHAVPLDPEVLDGPLGEGPDAQSDRQERLALVVLYDVSRLKEAERLKDEFISIAAHELRNPTAALKGFAQMLSRQADRPDGPPLDDLQREAIDAIEQASSRLVELTDDLLDVTRLQADRLDLRIEPHDLVALARRTAQRLQVTTERHTIQVRADDAYTVVDIDAKRIEQVLTNLINNAIKYSPAGGPVDIVIHAHTAAGIGELEVRDQGIGIPAEEQARVFGRFMRADNVRVLGISGTGLGLFLSRELVVRHGGSIWFESAEGQGSTFHMTLPLTRVSETDAPDDASSAYAPGSRHEI